MAMISQAQEKLGFEPTVDLKEGLERLSQWYFNVQTPKK
jgi:nucleoside-diphosphate-sugar epimerase